MKMKYYIITSFIQLGLTLMLTIALSLVGLMAEELNLPTNGQKLGGLEENSPPMGEAFDKSSRENSTEVAATITTMLSMITPPANNASLQADNFHEQQQQAEKQQAIQQQAQQPVVVPNSMSCFACSSMDYENSVENSCRTMTRHQYHHAHYPHHLPQRANFHQQQSTAINHQQVKQGSSEQQSGQEQQQLSTAQQQQTHSPYGGSSTQANYVHRTQLLYSNTTVKARPCVDDENFCSVVTVWRVGHMNNAHTSNFWAMERNCSRSCNTGCMLIGERVRLKVCSTCCRTPNCNIGSGSEANLARLRQARALNQVLCLLFAWMLVKKVANYCH